MKGGLQDQSRDRKEAVGAQIQRPSKLNGDRFMTDTALKNSDDRFLTGAALKVFDWDMFGKD